MKQDKTRQDKIKQELDKKEEKTKDVISIMWKYDITPQDILNLYKKETEKQSTCLTCNNRGYVGRNEKCLNCN